MRLGPRDVILQDLDKTMSNARVTEDDTLIRRGKKWVRYDALGKQLLKQLQKTLTRPEIEESADRMVGRRCAPSPYWCAKCDHAIGVIYLSQAKTVGCDENHL